MTSTLLKKHVHCKEVMIDKFYDTGMKSFIIYSQTRTAKNN